VFRGHEGAAILTLKAREFKWSYCRTTSPSLRQPGTILDAVFPLDRRRPENTPAVPNDGNRPQKGLYSILTFCDGAV